MAPGRLRYGVVGAGRVFQRFHLPALLAREDYGLAAVCDADPGQLGSLFGDDSVVRTTDLEEFLAAGLDVVAVCTPNDAHAGPVLGAIRSGAAVLCEKPLAADVAVARLLAEAAGGASLAGVNLPYRFHRLLPEYAAALPDGECEITVRFTTAGMRLWRPVTGWYAESHRAGGGALIDLGPHALDLLHAVFGAPRLVGATLDAAGVEERVVLQLAFERGPARVVIDRASRTVGLTVTARQGGTAVTLDLRRGEVRRGEEVLAATAEGIEGAAISRFLDAAAGRPAPVVGFGEALRLQEFIEGAYAGAVIDAELRVD
jgi:predicted dehydrogenase